MNEWIIREVSIPLWAFAIIAIYIVVSHTYVTYRLARSNELSNIWLKLRGVISVLPLPVKPNQKQWIQDEINNADHNIDSFLRDTESIKNPPNNNRQKERSNEPSQKPFHAPTIPPEKGDSNQNGTLPFTVKLPAKRAFERVERGKATGKSVFASLIYAPVGEFRGKLLSLTYNTRNAIISTVALIPR